jgi:hypothetical protein
VGEVVGNNGGGGLEVSVVLPGRKLLEALKEVEELFARAAEASKEVSGMLKAAARAPELKGPAFILLPQLLLARFLFPPTAARPIFATNAVKSLFAAPGKNARFRHKAILLHQ